MNRLLLILFVLLIFSGTSLVGEEMKYPFTGKITKNLKVLKKPQKSSAPLDQLKKETPITVITAQGKFLKVLFSYTGKIFMEKKFALLGTEKKGVVNANYVRVYLSAQSKKPLGYLHKGDRITLIRQQKNLVEITTPSLVVMGYIPQEDVRPLSEKISEKFQSLLLTLKTVKDPLVEEIKKIEQALEQELSKKIEDMDLRPLILRCWELEKKATNPRWKTVLSYLREKAMETKRIRDEYLKLTAPMRKEIEKSLK